MATPTQLTEVNPSASPALGSGPQAVGEGRTTISPTFTYPRGIMSPWAFAVIMLGLKLYPWQAEVLEALGQGLPVALCAANGSGKTQIVIASFILWFLYSFPKGICPVTSGSWTQLSDQLWPAVYQHRKKFPRWHWTK